MSGSGMVMWTAWEQCLKCVCKVTWVYIEKLCREVPEGCEKGRNLVQKVLAGTYAEKFLPEKPKFEKSGFWGENNFA